MHIDDLHEIHCSIEEDSDERIAQSTCSNKNISTVTKKAVVTQFVVDDDDCTPNS